MDDIANIFQDVRQRAYIEKYTPYKISGFKEKQPFRVEFKDKPRGRVAEVAKRKNYCHSCGSKDHYSNNSPKAKKKVFAIDKVPEQESPTEDSKLGKPALSHQRKELQESIREDDFHWDNYTP
ncbi:hypothetical protein O181_005281 [Austropuccinia psidii MF-1]|uniref:Uncharacterized protein n=1 Tax=Austropuccinia psidii MF-1 TaxID=1389203 RepID=A0A9Q3GFS0_9BASI|nr:hypothetical protein [Austropuccinia psidii MF-1]